MSEIYVPTNGRGNTFASASLGGLCVLATFALLPILVGITNQIIIWEGVPVETIADMIPETIIDEPDPIVEEPEKPDDIVMEEPLPPITLDQLLNLINPSDSGVSVPTDYVALTNAADTNIEVFLPGQLDEKPKVLSAVKPLYPYSMKGIAGNVIVEFIIDENGKVLRPRIYKSSHREFEQAAIDSVKKSHWQAGTINGKSVRSIVRLPIEFSK